MQAVPLICGPATVPWSNPSSAVKGKGGAACNSLAPRDFLPPPPGPPFISSASLFGTIVPALFGNWKPHFI